MKNVLYVSEIYELLEKASSDDERVNILIDNFSKELESTIYHTFAPEVEFFTTEEVTYKKNKLPPDLSVLPYNMAMNILYIFIKNHPRVSRNLTDERKKTMLIQTLEELAGREADVFLNMILKRPGSPCLTRDIIKRAFPTLLPDKVE